MLKCSDIWRLVLEFCLFGDWCSFLCGVCLLSSDFLVFVIIYWFFGFSEWMPYLVSFVAKEVFNSLHVWVWVKASLDEALWRRFGFGFWSVTEIWKSGTEIWIWILIQIFLLQILMRFLCFNPKNLSETIVKKLWSWFIRSELVGRIRIQLVQWKKNQFLIQVPVTTRLNSWFYFPLLLLIHCKNWRLDMGK